MNCKVISIETPHTQTTHNSNTRRNEYRKFNENYVRNEDYIAIVKKQKLQNSQGKKWKIHELLTHIPMNDITELNELIYAEAKFVWQNRCSTKEHS